jgi:hypothetical protein
MVLLRIVIIPITIVHPGLRALLSWLTIFLAILWGYLGLYFGQIVNLPDLWSPRISHTRRFIFPLGMGLFFALIFIIIDTNFKIIPNFEISFPATLPVFLLEGLVSTLTLYFFPLVFIYWLFSSVIFRQKYPHKIFWLVAIGVALIGPSLNLIKAFWYYQNVAPSFLSFVAQVTFNLGLAAFFKKYGLLSGLTLKISYNLAWFVLWTGARA